MRKAFLIYSYFWLLFNSSVLIYDAYKRDFQQIDLMLWLLSLVIWFVERVEYHQSKNSNKN